MSAPEAWHVTRTMRALELLALQPRPAAEIADTLGVHPRTARRLLNRLVAEGYATRTESPQRLYASSLKLVGVAAQVLDRSEILASALPFIRGLRDKTVVSAHLSVVSYRSTLSLIHEPSDDASHVQLARLVPCHCSAAGKALLAHCDRWAASILSQPLESHTDRTITTPDELARELTRTRSRGFAVEDGEYLAGVASIAAPIFDHHGEALAALGVTTATTALTEDTTTALARAVLVSAEALSEQLGYVTGAAPTPEPLQAILLDMIPAARSYAA